MTTAWLAAAALAIVAVSMTDAGAATSECRSQADGIATVTDIPIWKEYDASIALTLKRPFNLGLYCVFVRAMRAIAFRHFSSTIKRFLRRKPRRFGMNDALY
jgi:hypothetical protein